MCGCVCLCGVCVCGFVASLFFLFTCCNCNYGLLSEINLMMMMMMNAPEHSASELNNGYTT